MNNEPIPVGAAGTEDIISETSVQTKPKKKRIAIPQPVKDFAARHERLYLIWAFILPFMLMWLIYIAMEVYPFGGNSVLVLDLNGQYVSFFETLRDLIVNGGSLAYSWERALGGEFMGIYAYYLASPLSFIVALFPKGMITEALLFMFLTKAGLCGLSMGFYMHTQFKSKRMNVVIFSTLYALTAYAVVQQHNTMWIDELAILPILALGIDRLISHKKCSLFCASLALALIANFYIGYMMCLFTFFYFFYSYFANGYDNLNNVMGERFHFVKSLARIGAASVVAIMIAAIIILPTYYSLTFGKTTFSEALVPMESEDGLKGILAGINFDSKLWNFEQNFDFIDFIAKLYPGSYDTVRPDGLPFVYCGTLSLILLPLYFTAPNVKPREKILGGVALIFLVVCMNTSVIDLIWHGFQRPNWLNYRYSFMFCFFMVLFAYRAFSSLERIDFKWPVISCGIFALLIVIIQKLGVDIVSELRCVWMSILFLGAAIVGLYFAVKKPLKEYSSFILAMIMCIEMFAAGLLNVTDLDADVVYTSRTTYTNYMNRLSPIVNAVKERDDGFYRMEKSVHRKTNDPMALGYNGISNSTSTLNASIIKLLNQLGLASKSHWSKYIGGTPVTDSLLGVKYMIYEDEESAPFYNLIESDEDHELWAYENPYVLSIAYAVNDAVREMDFEDYDTPFELMNDMVTQMLGEENEVELFKSLKIKEIDYDNCDIGYVTGHKKYSPEDEDRSARIYYYITPKTDDPLYCFFPTEYPRECTLSVNSQGYGSILGNDSDAVKYLGYFPIGEELQIELTLEDAMMYMANGGTYFWQLDTALFNEYMPKLAEALFNVEDFSDTMLSGTITVPENRTTLFTTIPYDEAWTITIDGESAEIFKTAESLLACEIEPGEHEVKFEYKSKYIRYGTILTVTGTVILAASFGLGLFLEYRKKSKAEEETDTVTEEN
nr:YfhO family protein [Clostridia bacterium]